MEFSWTFSYGLKMATMTQSSWLRKADSKDFPYKPLSFYLRRNVFPWKSPEKRSLFREKTSPYMGPLPASRKVEKKSYLPRRNGMAIRRWSNHISFHRAGLQTKSGWCQESEDGLLGRSHHICLLSLLLQPWVKVSERLKGRGRKTYSWKLTAHDDRWFQTY